ncbi:MAG TPA: tripartite tricarboxylate transporter substrate binding protein [Xanthobacteraceae bacterium]|nr:tripartite tricarboxylate transporter substrate binding protein [Xanthobacteraceae bacterium]
MIGRRLAAALAVLAFGASTVAAQQYPNKIIKIVSPAPPGGSTDIMARLIAPGLQEDLKQTVIVEAKGGAGGYLGSEHVAKSAPDGYTLLLGGAFTAITASLQKNPSYLPRKDLVPVAIFTSVPNLLVAGPRLKANTVAELVAEAKANPGKFNIGSNGIGTTLHLSGELFKLQTGTKIEHIAYRGWADCIAGVTGGEVDMMFDNLSTAVPLIKAGKLRPLAVAATERHRALPDVPTLGELGIKNAEVTSWFGIMAPAGTPQAVIDKLGVTFKKIADNPEFQKLVAQQGMDVTFQGPADALKFWNGEVDKWEGVIKAAGITAQ